MAIQSRTIGQRSAHAGPSYVGAGARAKGSGSEVFGSVRRRSESPHFANLSDAHKTAIHAAEAAGDVRTLIINGHIEDAHDRLRGSGISAEQGKKLVLAVIADLAIAHRLEELLHTAHVFGIEMKAVRDRLSNQIPELVFSGSLRDFMKLQLRD